MITQKRINDAIVEAKELEKQKNAIFEEYLRAETREEKAEKTAEHKAFDKEAKVDNVSVIASYGGNTVANHWRISFKIDGKRASRAKVEKLIEG